jgi:hypothetical protein
VPFREKLARYSDHLILAWMITCFRAYDLREDRCMMMRLEVVQELLLCDARANDQDLSGVAEVTRKVVKQLRGVVLFVGVLTRVVQVMHRVHCFFLHAIALETKNLRITMIEPHRKGLHIELRSQRFAICISTQSANG